MFAHSHSDSHERASVNNREVKFRFMTSLTGAEISDNCGLWAP